QAVKERGDGGAVHEELLLALAYQRLGKDGEARRWLTRATAWLDGPRQTVQAAGVPASAGRGPGEALLTMKAARAHGDRRGRGRGWQAWLELEILRREAERLLKAGKG